MTNEIIKILQELRDQSVMEIVNHNVIDEWDTLGVARDVVRGRKDSFSILSHSREELSPWAIKCCHYINGTKTGDCDVALRSVVIYWILLNISKQEGSGENWKIRSKYYLCDETKKRELIGDTMNSYATPMLRLIRDKYFLPEYQERMKLEGSLDEDSRFTSKYGQFGRNREAWSAYILDWYDVFIKRFEAVLQKENISKEAVYEYIRLNDTLGNFIPVPFHWCDGTGEFNRPRGDYRGKTQDYWDLALHIIWQWYIHDKKDEDGRNKLLLKLVKYFHSGKKKITAEEIEKRTQQNIKNCEEWLRAFVSEKKEPCWSSFVEKNFLQDFVNQNDDGTFGKPRELWIGHFSGNVMPQTPADYQQFFTNASAMITARGVRIALAIKKRLSSMSHDDLVALAKEMVGEK